MTGEPVTRSLGNFALEASVQADDGFPGFGSFMPASSAFRKSERKKRITEQKFFGNFFFRPFLKEYQGCQ